MSPNFPLLRKSSRNPMVAVLAAFGALALITGSFATSAGAVETSGGSVVTLGTGKAGQKLIRQGVRFKATAPATRKKLSKGKARIAASANDARVGDAATVSLRGGLVLKRGKRQLKLRGLVLKSGANQTTVKAKLGGKQTTIGKVNGSSLISADAGTVEMSGGKFSLAGKAINKTKQKLRLKKSPKGVIGKMDVEVQAAFEDPYLAECGLAADTKTAGTLPAATPPPSLSGAVSTNGNPVNWGVKLSLRGYIAGVGKIVGLDGAVVNELPFPGPPPTGFTWPDEAEYAANGPGAGDDQAVLNGSGSILFCNEPHGFRIVLSDPTVVIDGANSRLIADVDTNTTDLGTGISDWIPAQRIDFATLDTSAVAPAAGAGTLTWTEVPTRLTAAGAESLRLCEGNPGPCTYVEGAEFDPITVTVKTAG
ncbi:MAG: HtaA domain-containing protein [Solirubrobacterales bacterium]|nr:HtaA domain-containing protein [Solirubrobacterales bacterium]